MRSEDMCFLIYADTKRKLIVLVGPFKELGDARLFDVGMHYAAKESRDFVPQAIVEFGDMEIIGKFPFQWEQDLRIKACLKALEIRAAMEGYELQPIPMNPTEWTESKASRLNLLPSSESVTGK